MARVKDAAAKAPQTAGNTAVKTTGTSGAQTLGQPIRAGMVEILEKCSRLMARHGFYGTSMRDLANATGRSLGGLYHYFNSKEDLVALVNLHGYSALTNTLGCVRGQVGQGPIQLYAAIYNHISYLTAHWSEFQVMDLGLEMLPLSQRRQTEALRDGYFQLLLGVVADALAGDEVPPKAEGADWTVTEVRVLLAMIKGYLPDWGNAKIADADEAADRIFDLFMLGATRMAAKDRPSLVDPAGRAMVQARFKKCVCRRIWESTPLTRIETCCKQ